MFEFNDVPLFSTLSLSDNCNFNCVHCYMTPIKHKNVLDFKSWKNIIDILVMKGCVYLTLTGGEPFLNKNFCDIYKYAYSKNLKISIMTNLSLLNDNHIETLKKYKPKLITVSLYGMSENTYKNFCKINNQYERVINNILKLKKHNINLKLTTVLNKLNYNELEDFKIFCESKDINYMVYRNIHCDVNGGLDPLNYQISLNQVIDSYRVLDDAQDMRNFYTENRFTLWDGNCKACGAGNNSCYVDSLGNMYLCNGYTDEKFNIKTYGFDECWNLVKKVRKEKVEIENPCNKCDLKIFCGKCTPNFLIKNKSEKFPFKECEDSRIMINALGGFL